MPRYIDPTGRVIYHGKLTLEEQQECYGNLQQWLEAPGESEAPSITLEELGTPHLCTVCLHVAAVTRSVGKLIFLQRCQCMPEEEAYGAVPGFSAWFCRCCATLLPEEDRQDEWLYCHACRREVRQLRPLYSFAMPPEHRYEFRAHRWRIKGPPYGRDVRSPKLDDLAEADRLERAIVAERSARVWMRMRLRVKLDEESPGYAGFIPLWECPELARLGDEDRAEVADGFVNWLLVTRADHPRVPVHPSRQDGGDPHAA